MVVPSSLPSRRRCPRRRSHRRVAVARSRRRGVAVAGGAGPGRRRGQRPGRRRRSVSLHGQAVPGARVQARADGCPVGTPRAVMNIKHPCKPKPVCCCIPIAILLQDGLQDLKCAVITLVYTRYIPGLESADSEKISLVYPRHMTFTWKSMEQGYTRYIPGI